MDIFHRKSSKRGQAAIEFLMTYGWMLLIVLIVGALIFSFVDFGSLLPNTVDLNNNFRAEPTQSQAEATNEHVLVTFQYNGNDRVEINSSASRIDNIEGAAAAAACDVVWVKNIDTDISTTGASPGLGIVAGGTTSDPVVFLRSQIGLMEFDCTTGAGGPGLIEGDVLTGEITIIATSSRTGVPIKSEGNLRLGISS